MIPGRKSDVISGLIFVAFGAAFAGTALTYDLGRAIRMGPGYMPLVLGTVLVLLGLAILVVGLRHAPDTGEPAPVPWRGMVLVVVTLLFFGYCIRALGFAPTVLAGAFATAMASQRNTIASALVVALGVTALCIAIFIYGLGVPIPLVGPWLGGY
ncbi:tripartite tricarboxylate transporter TctB family protein [Marinivivus vitaminiproducens]|uniref:tripartite tricarboxylate transporter TctB family protein n=1 Tax=Marinivivus vitaminiproducens TaxID=3035935 RepID=UPI002799BB78|nr:tripartite tricarboxylate transporter TctB family protein [Geminicoccaceae bacterium SCSIO 64248]